MSVTAGPTHASDRLMRGRRIRVILAGLLVGWLLAVAMPARAYHQPCCAGPLTTQTKGWYPDTGYFWIDDVSAGNVYQSSDRCENAEITMHQTFGDQLKGVDEGNGAQYRGKWRLGIDMFHYTPGSGQTCVPTSVTDNLTDWHFDYISDSSLQGTGPWTDTGHGPGYAGESHSTLASTSWCNIWIEPNLPSGSRCGYHITRVHIWKERFQGYAYDYRVRFLLHEGAHGMGFWDYCNHSHPDGTVGRSGGPCTLTVTGYYPMDRLLIGDYIYRNSPVHN